MAPKSRTKNLLKLGLAADEQIESALKHNTETCRLLSMLSPELRNRIYGLVLSDRDLHICETTKKFFLDGRWQSKVWNRVCVSAEAGKDGMYQHSHGYCFNSNSLPLALLQTCRQIHSEAALISLACNTYVVESQVFNVFMRSLLGVQKAAIKNLTLVMGPGRWSHGEIAAKEMDGLDGVKHLKLIIAGLSDIHHDPLRSLEKLARLPLKTVKILIEVDAAFGVSTMSVASLQDAADGLKPKLLRSWAETEQERMEAEEEAAIASEMEYGSLVERRRAGQLKRGLK